MGVWGWGWQAGSIGREGGGQAGSKEVCVCLEGGGELSQGAAGDERMQV